MPCFYSTKKMRLAHTGRERKHAHSSVVITWPAMMTLCRRVSLFLLTTLYHTISDFILNLRGRNKIMQPAARGQYSGSWRAPDSLLARPAAAAAVPKAIFHRCCWHHCLLRSLRVMTAITLMRRRQEGVLKGDTTNSFCRPIFSWTVIYLGLEFHFSRRE